VSGFWPGASTESELVTSGEKKKQNLHGHAADGKKNQLLHEFNKSKGLGTIQKNSEGVVDSKKMSSADFAKNVEQGKSLKASYLIGKGGQVTLSRGEKKCLGHRGGDG